MKGLWLGRYRLDGRAAMTCRLAAWWFFVGAVAWRADAGILSVPAPPDDLVQIGELYEGRRFPKEWVPITRSKSAPQPVRQKGLERTSETRDSILLLHHRDVL